MESPKSTQLVNFFEDEQEPIKIVADDNNKITLRLNSLPDKSIADRSEEKSSRNGHAKHQHHSVGRNSSQINNNGNNNGKDLEIVLEGTSVRHRTMNRSLNGIKKDSNPQLSLKKYKKTKRIRIFHSEGNTSKSGKVIVIPDDDPSFGMSKFCVLVRKKLGIQPIQIFLDNECEIEDLSEINDGDSLYIMGNPVCAEDVEESLSFIEKRCLLTCFILENNFYLF